MMFKLQALTCRILGGLAAGLILVSAALAEEFPPTADRVAIEQVYYQHRLGEKTPFDQAMPPATLARLVQWDQRKEAVLQKYYHVRITPAMLNTEVLRINTTTRAPEMLAEIKAALGHDPARFAEAFAKPFLVERLLHAQFDNDDVLHAPQRQQVEQARNELLAARSRGADYPALLAGLYQKNSNAVSEITWQLAPRPVARAVSGSDEMAIKKRFGANAQILDSPWTEERTQPRFYFTDLSAELQNVLRVQLQNPGDVSAVIETPSGFLLYLARAKTATELSVAVLSLPKNDYTQWLKQQNLN